MILGTCNFLSTPWTSALCKKSYGDSQSPCWSPTQETFLNMTVDLLYNNLHQLYNFLHTLHWSPTHPPTSMKDSFGIDQTTRAFLSWSIMSNDLVLTAMTTYKKTLCTWGTNDHELCYSFLSEWNVVLHSMPAYLKKSRQTMNFGVCLSNERASQFSNGNVG